VCVRMQVVCDVCRVRADGTARVLALHTQCELHNVCPYLFLDVRQTVYAKEKGAART
jgi:hypothetical protein